MFEGFRDFSVQVDSDINIFGKEGGAGPPLLLIHGYPQNYRIWHKVAHDLAKSYTLLIPDLRGYGQSSKPRGLPDHSNYSFRAMANDMIGLMRHFGHEKFFVCGHDRGGRVGHRLAVDHPDAVLKLMVLDICPTLTMYETAGFGLAKAYYHWFFLMQNYPLPETAITNSPDVFSAHFQTDAFHPEVRDTYRDGLADWDTCHSMCEDYRAAASIDLDHAREDIAAGRDVKCPLRCLWGQAGHVGALYEPLTLWKEVCTGEVDGEAVPSGHYVPEHAHAELMNHARGFFVMGT